MDIQAHVYTKSQGKEKKKKKETDRVYVKRLATMNIPEMYTIRRNRTYVVNRLFWNEYTRAATFEQVLSSPVFAGAEHICFELELARNWLNGADRKHGKLWRW